MNFKIPFSGRAHRYTKDEIELVARVMQDANPLTQGQYQQEFENRFCAYVGAENAFSVCNATAALELAAQLCQFEEGDEVVVPSHTFTASVYPFIKQGAKVVWADIDPCTRVTGVSDIEKRLTPRTRAIVVVHLYGYVADMAQIMELARRHDLLVIEDAAQSIGAALNGKKSGTFGDFGIFSFHSHKNISTLGEGGMLVVRDEKYARLIPQLRHNGHCAFDFERPNYWTPAMGNVDLPQLDGNFLLPNNYCLGEVECALGSRLLERVDRVNQEKRDRALRFIDAFEQVPELQFHRVDDVRHNYHLLVARVARGKRDAFMDKMALQKGVQCVVQYCPLNRYPLYQKLGLGQADCPEADAFFDNMVSFPFHHWLSEEDFEYVMTSAREVIEQLG